MLAGHCGKEIFKGLSFSDGKYTKKAQVEFCGEDSTLYLTVRVAGGKQKTYQVPAELVLRMARAVLRMLLSEKSMTVFMRGLFSGR